MDLEPWGLKVKRFGRFSVDTRELSKCGLCMRRVSALAKTASRCFGLGGSVCNFGAIVVQPEMTIYIYTHMYLYIHIHIYIYIYYELFLSIMEYKSAAQRPGSGQPLGGSAPPHRRSCRSGRRRPPLFTVRLALCRV